MTIPQILTKANLHITKSLEHTSKAAAMILLARMSMNSTKTNPSE